MQPLLDIGIPCFNHYKYLRRCIESIYKYFKNDADKIWIWICDDCSNYSEGYLKIIDDYKNIFNFSYIKNEINSGPGISRNHVIEKGQGKWITFIDDDDIFCRNPINDLIEDVNFYTSEVKKSNGKIMSLATDYSNVMYGIILSRNFVKSNKLKFFTNLQYAGTEDSALRILIFSITDKIKIIENFAERVLREPGQYSNYYIEFPEETNQYNAIFIPIINFITLIEWKEQIKKPQILLEVIHDYLNKDIEQFNNIKIEQIKYYYLTIYFYLLFYIFNNLFEKADVIKYLSYPTYYEHLIELFFIFYASENLCEFKTNYFIYTYKNNQITQKLQSNLIPTILKIPLTPNIFNYQNFYEDYIKNYWLPIIDIMREQRKSREDE